VNDITAKVLVLGDQSVGKSSLVHLLAEQRVLAAPRWTVGCAVDVLLFGANQFVALWDVGGAPRFERSRELFFADADAVVLVHDLTNRRSYSNLRRWLRELTAYFNPAAVAPTTQWAASEAGDAANADLVHVMDLDVGNGLSLPVLVLGNKLDEVAEDAAKLDVEGGAADSVHVSAHDVRAFAPGSVGGTAISRLFERALARARARLASTATVSSAGSFLSSPSSMAFGDTRRPSTHRSGAVSSPLASPNAIVSPSSSSSLFSQIDDDNLFNDRSRIDAPISSAISSVLSGGGGGGGGSGRRKSDKKD
jgi:Rab-like protein 3